MPTPRKARVVIAVLAVVGGVVVVWFLLALTAVLRDPPHP